MGKPLNKFSALHEQFSDCLEYLATYGLDSLSDNEQVFAKKIATLATEYIDTISNEDPNYDREQDSEFDDSELEEL
jgi:hypothetical protein